MKTFLQKHEAKINGVISCFDRIIFKGYLPLTEPKSMENFLGFNKILIKDFKNFVPQQAEKLKTHAQNMAQKTGRPFEYLNGYVRKEDKAREIAQKDRIKQGLVCIFSAVEPVRSFVMRRGENRPCLQSAWRKCLCLYFYFMDREFGLMHIRIQTWFPFTIQIDINGHEWLMRKLDENGIAYTRADNAVTSVENGGRTQKFADKMQKKKWISTLDAFAKRVNPLLKNLLAPMSYYWVISQAEYSTDILFKDRAALAPLYQKLLKHNTLCFGAEDILTFLGRKLHPRFEGEVLTDCKNKRIPGARIKHRMKENRIKMYDKQGCVLRVETVINNPREFKVRKNCQRKGVTALAWTPMSKSVANMDGYQRVALKANHSYIEAMASIEDPSASFKHLHQIATPQKINNRPLRGFNPVLPQDVKLFQSVLRGEHVIQGFRNKDIRSHLFGETKNQDLVKKQSAAVSRNLKRLHAHQLIAKIPRSRRWKVTHIGNKFMAASILLKEDVFPASLKIAA